MAKLTLNNIESGFASITQLNGNFDLIEEAFENTLSRDGTTPNQMESDLDMNSNGILNVGSLFINGVDIADLESGATAAAASAAAALASELAAAASAASAGNVVDLEYMGPWATSTVYAVNNIVYEAPTGSSYIATVAHTSGTFATDLADGKWGLLATQGAAGAGTGDMLKTENLSGLANYTTARTNLGLTIGTHVQAYDALLAALAAQTTAAAKIQGYSGVDTATLYDFKDEDNMVSNSATAVPSQQSVKAYVDTSIATSAAPAAGTTYTALRCAGDVSIYSTQSGWGPYVEFDIISPAAGTVTITADAARVSDGNIFVQVTKNGTTMISITITSTTFATYSYNLSCDFGDLIRVGVFSTSANRGGYIKNINVKTANKTITAAMRRELAIPATGI